MKKNHTNGFTADAAYILGYNPNQSAKSELLDHISQQEASEHVLMLMIQFTQSEYWSSYTEESQSNFWHKTNMIRAVLANLKKKEVKNA